MKRDPLPGIDDSPETQILIGQYRRHPVLTPVFAHWGLLSFLAESPERGAPRPNVLAAFTVACQAHQAARTNFTRLDEGKGDQYDHAAQAMLADLDAFAANVTDKLQKKFKLSKKEIKSCQGAEPGQNPAP